MRKREFSSSSNTNINDNDEKKSLNKYKYRCHPNIFNTQEHKCERINLHNKFFNSTINNYNSLEECDMRCTNYRRDYINDNLNTSEVDGGRERSEKKMRKFESKETNSFLNSLDGQNQVINKITQIQNLYNNLMMIRILETIDENAKQLEYEELLCRTFTTTDNNTSSGPDPAALIYFDSFFQQLLEDIKRKNSIANLQKNIISPPSFFLLPCILNHKPKKENLKLYFDSLTHDNQKLLIKEIFENNLLNSLIPILVDDIISEYRDNDLTFSAIDGWLNRGSEWYSDWNNKFFNRQKITDSLLKSLVIDPNSELVQNREITTVQLSNYLDIFQLPQINFYLIHSPYIPNPLVPENDSKDIFELRNYLDFFISVIQSGIITRAKPGAGWINIYKSEAKNFLKLPWVIKNPEIVQKLDYIIKN
jgi:hypothetical protein